MKVWIWRFGFTLFFVCFVFFVSVSEGFFVLFWFFFNGVYLQITEKKIRRQPSHRGAVEILLYLTSLR